MTRTILPHELPTALDRHADPALLSLDCFDTLLWRDLHAPGDLFHLLDGITPRQRVRAETTARKARVLDRAPSGEVTLAEIYAAMRPHASAHEIERLVAQECAAEARHAFAFAPTVALMRAAKARGLPVVVVSDTYFTAEQLEALLRAAAGDEVVALIDRIFCSCDHRSAKGERLFEAVVAEMGVVPGRVLHIGDNPRADVHGAERHGIAALHLVQFDGDTVQRLRQEKAAGAIVAGPGAAFQPHRAALAAGLAGIDNPAEALGFGVLGPVLTPFARWIVDEAAALAATSEGRVHILFLMRDGHLPREVFAAIAPEVETHAVEISRFAGTAASLTDEAAIRRFLLDEIGDNAGIELLRQLMIEGDEAGKLLAGLPRHDRERALVDTLSSAPWLATISARSGEYAGRLLDYLRRTVPAEAGDTVMLVDLGYSGTVQNRIEPLLREAMGVRSAGRYLLLAEDFPTGADKRGFVAADSVDNETLHALLSCVAVVEQFCTVAQGSVVDYRDGRPVRASAVIKGGQSATRDRVQAGCVAFAARGDGDAIRRAAPSPDAMRHGAIAALARLLYLPLPRELTLLKRFEHDGNLGSDGTVMLFDPDAAARGLREHGLFYLKDQQRMFLPAELRGQGLPTSLALMTQARFGLDLRYADFCDATVTLPVLVVDGTDAFVDTVKATPTHDGWYVAAVPIGAARYSVGIQFGRLYEHVQVDAVRIMPVSAYLTGADRVDASAHPAPFTAEDMEAIAPGLFRCDGDGAFLMVSPPRSAMAGVPLMLTVLFRPITPRAAVADRAATSRTLVQGIAR